MATKPEDALGKSELAAILASAMDAIIAIDAAHEIVLFNAAAEKMFGCSKADVLGASIERFIPERYRAEHRNHIRRFSESGMTTRRMGTLGEVWGLRASGEEFPIEASIGTVAAGGRELLSVILRDVSARKDAEARLRESQRTLSTLVGNLPGMAYRCLNDNAWTMQFVSEGCRALTGYGPQELVEGEIVYGDLIHPDDRADVWSAVQGAIERRGHFNLNYRIRRRDGAVRCVSERGVEVRNEQEADISLLEGIIIDVTELKTAEDILRGRNRALQDLAGGASLDVVLATLSRSAEEIFPELRCSVLLLDEEKRHLLHGSAPRLPDFYVRAIDGIEIGPDVGSCGAASFLGRRVVVEDVNTHPNWVAYRGLAAQAEFRACWSEPIFATDGATLGTFAMYSREPRAPQADELEFIETTAHLAGIAIERSRIDALRRESERRFRAVFNQRIELAGFVTLDGILTDANERSLGMIGADYSEVVGRPFWDTPWWEHDPALQERLRSAIAEAGSGEFVRFDAEHPRTDGAMAIVDFSLTPILNERGTVQMLLAEGVDVTEQKRAKEALRESEKRANEAEKLASIATLTAGIAHDIGAPMTAILGYAEMMQKSLSDEKNRRRAGIIVEQLNRITELVQALLNMARPDERAHVSVDIAEVIEKSLNFYREMLRKRGIAVERALVPVPVIAGDPNRLQQALLNLFINAADAMREGGTLRVALNSPGSGIVEIRIGDSGVGIAPDQLERIFEPFYTTKQRGQGTGLGLLVAKSIVNEHLGTIAVESSPGQGTTFTICLPTSED